MKRLYCILGTYLEIIIFLSFILTSLWVVMAPFVNIYALAWIIPMWLPCLAAFIWWCSRPRWHVFLEHAYYHDSFSACACWRCCKHRQTAPSRRRSRLPRAFIVKKP